MEAIWPCVREIPQWDFDQNHIFFKTCIDLWPQNRKLLVDKILSILGKLGGQKIISVGNFLTPHFFCEMRTFRNSINSSLRMPTLHCIFMKINSATFPQLLQFNPTQYTLFSHNYVWRKKGWLLHPKSPKKWRILSSKSFRFWGHQSMHGLKKIRFGSKSHCPEDL